MSEYWKSTPKYWCKHCSCYVRDTKLERKNHESTARHQGAIQRSLRNMYREHEREEREKDRAKQEIARLNGLVPRGDAASATTAAPPTTQPREATEAERRRQREQLAEMGVAMPETLRGGMAMAGEWTVTNTRVIDHEPGQVEAKATGVRKRLAAPEREGGDDDKDDDDDDDDNDNDEEEAVRRLFKKPRKWGKDSKLAYGEEEARDLDALLNGTVIELKKKRRGSQVATTNNDDDHHPHEEVDETKCGIKKEEEIEVGKADVERIKKEEEIEVGKVDVERIKQEEETEVDKAEVEPVVSAKADPVTVKEEPDMTAEKLVGADRAVVFKKRKPIGIRTK